MKKILFLFSLVMLSMTSCLKHDLEEMESSDLCDLANVEFEYRWTEEIVDAEGNPTGVHELQYKVLEVEKTKDETNHKYDLKISVPLPDATFTKEIRDQVSLDKIVGLFTVSTASRVEPLNGAPVLGKVGDFSNGPFTYRVIAASGTYTDWVINISEFDNGIDITKIEWDDAYDKSIVSGHTGDELQLKVKYTPDIATDKKLEWKVEDPTVASVNEDGLLKLLAPGKTSLTVTTTDGSNLSLTRSIAVDFVPVSEIKLQEKFIIMDLQDNMTYTVKDPVINPEDAMEKELEWIVENEEVATIDPATRTLTAKTAGATNLIVRAKDGFGAEARVTLTVSEDPVPEPEEEVYIGASTMTASSNIQTTQEPTADTDHKEDIPYNISSVRNGATASYGNAKVQIGYYKTVTMRASTENLDVAEIDVHLDGVDGPKVATVKMDRKTGTWTIFDNFTAELNLDGVDLSRLHTIHLRFRNTAGGAWTCNLHYIKLSME